MRLARPVRPFELCYLLAEVLDFLFLLYDLDFLALEANF